MASVACPSYTFLVPKTLFISIISLVLFLDLTSVPEAPGHQSTGDTRLQIWTLALVVNESPATRLCICPPGISEILEIFLSFSLPLLFQIPCLGRATHGDSGVLCLLSLLPPSSPLLSAIHLSHMKLPLCSSQDRRIMRSFSHGPLTTSMHYDSSYFPAAVKRHHDNLQQKIFIGAHSSRELESVTIMVGGTAADRQAWGRSSS